MEGLSGGGLVLYCFTVTFASIDWVMSLEPRWYSTIYGLLFMVGQALAAMAFAITVSDLALRPGAALESREASHLQDLGSFLLTFVMLWAYLEFSQFLIIWGGNLSEEIPWYIRRMQGLWGRVGLLLVVLNFALPFFLSVSPREAANTFLVDCGRVGFADALVDMYWMVLPAFGGGNAHVTWMNVVLPVGMGGLWFAYFTWQLQRMPILPVNDPRLKGVAEHAVEHG